MRFQLRCVHDIRINLNVIYASSVLMFVRFTHQGISFNLEGCPQAIADGGWGQPEKELQTRWPLLTYGEGEGEVLSLINHSFGDGPQVQSIPLHVYVLSLSSFYFFTKKQDLGEGNKETNAFCLSLREFSHGLVLRKDSFAEDKDVAFLLSVPGDNLHSFD